MNSDSAVVEEGDVTLALAPAAMSAAVVAAVVVAECTGLEYSGAVAEEHLPCIGVHRHRRLQTGLLRSAEAAS